MRMLKRTTMLVAMLALILGACALLGETRAWAKKGYSVDFGLYDGLTGIKHKFGTLTNGSVLNMYEGECIYILNPAYDIVITKGEQGTIESSLGTNANYFRTTKKGEYSVDLMLNPEDESKKISFTLKVVDASILDELHSIFIQNPEKESVLKLKYKEDKLTGTLSISLVNSGDENLYIKILNMCAKDNDTKFQKIGAGKTKTAKATFKEIEKNEIFEKYYPLTSKEEAKLAKGKTVKLTEFGVEFVIKYKGVYIF